MYDLIGDHLSVETTRYIIVWTIAISAPMVGFLSFAVTRGAGFRCPLAMLRSAQRFFLFLLSISLAYVGAFIAAESLDAVPLAPLLVLFLLFMLSTMVSGIRHLMAPAIAVDNTWAGAWRVARERARRLLPETEAARNLRRVR